MPVIIALHDYNKLPSRKIIRQFGDNRTNILFTGRIAPNKKQEDVISVFSYYKKYFDPQARLFLVGSSVGAEKYEAALHAYVEALQLSDVYFTGHVSFEQILAYYKVADVFLCQSEHEGFCVPLVEAMLFDVPIVAKSTSAIPYTLAGSGVLLNSSDPLLTAGVINRVVHDVCLHEQIVSGQRKRLKDFATETLKEDFLHRLQKVIG